ncbi:Uncharacterised protein g8710 [Pycnogonum litorale]
MNIAHFCILALLIVAIFLCLTVEAKAVQKRSVVGGGMLQKRPFCNTFTGCGRKRSESYRLTDDDLETYQRQILKDARLWELLQSRIQDENNDSQSLLRKKKRSVGTSIQ